MTKLVKEQRLLWTLLVRGEADVSLGAAYGPPLHHKGGETVWKTMMTPSEVDDVEAYLVVQGLTVERTRQSRQEIMQRQPDEVHMTASLSDIDPSQVVYRTPRCPLCFFFQPQSAHQCGVDDWPLESRTAAVQRVAKAAADLAECEVHRGQGGE